jgi:hypothetical protein
MCHCELTLRHFGCVLTTAVPWLRRLAAGLPPRRPGFDPGLVHVGFVVDKVALGQVPPPPRVLRFFPCQIHSTGAPLLGKGLTTALVLGVKSLGLCSRESQITDYTERGFPQSLYRNAVI